MSNRASNTDSTWQVIAEDVPSDAAIVALAKLLLDLADSEPGLAAAEKPEPQPAAIASYC